MTKITLSEECSILIDSIMSGKFTNPTIYSLFEIIVGKDDAATYASPWVGANRPLDNLYNHKHYTISYKQSAYLK